MKKVFAIVIPLALVVFGGVGYAITHNFGLSKSNAIQSEDKLYPTKYYRNPKNSQDRLWMSYYDNAVNPKHINYLELDSDGHVVYVEDGKTTPNPVSNKTFIDPTAKIRQGSVSSNLTNEVFDQARALREPSGGGDLVSLNEINLYTSIKGTVHWYNNMNLKGYSDLPPAIQELHQKIKSEPSNFPIASNILGSVSATEVGSIQAVMKASPYLFPNGDADSYPTLKMTQAEAMNIPAFRETLGYELRHYFIQSAVEKKNLEDVWAKTVFSKGSGKSIYSQSPILIQLTDKKKAFFVTFQELNFS